ncbi:tyrosine-type recombinase/integrase [uncultured Amnibacterium sp.]|uniref:tyrosine-type recombinase/integrase n=1 Tax=uncultured Amnibacterium sp. TaxID=1631851 RepID=UPI0035CBFDEB
MADLYRRCGCRTDGHLYPPLPSGATAEQRAATCPHLVADAKHGSWGFALSAGKDSASGQRIQVRRMGFPTKRAAQAERARLLAQVASGRYSHDRSLTVREWLSEWLERRVRDGLRPSTTVMYRRYVERDLQPGLGHLRLSELRHHHVDRFLQAQLASGRGVVTVRRMHAVLSSALSAAHRLDLVEANAASNIGLPPERPQSRQMWEPAQVGRFLDNASTDRLGPLFEIAVFTGLRRGELLGLQWADLDLDQGELVVRRQRVDAGGHAVEGEAKTAAGQNRRVGLGPVAIAAFETWATTQKTDQGAWQNQWQGADWVFTREDGAPLLPQFVTKRFERLVLQAQLPTMTFHGLRHQHASLLIAQGIDLAVVSKRLGHSSIAITNDLYSHLLRDTNRQAGEAAEALVPRGAEAPARPTAHTLHTRGPRGRGKKEAPAEDFLF